MHRPIIMTVCGDPGGAEAIAPVIKIIEADERTKAINYAYRQGADVLTYHGIVNRPLPSKVEVQEVCRLFQEDRVLVLLTATSHNNLNWEKFFIHEARKLGIHSLAVLDFWSNYAVRFSDAEGNLLYMPDKIAVMDDRAQREMIAAGIFAERIMVTGQPAFDALAEYRKPFPVMKQHAIRASMKIQGNELLVVFVSQPLRKVYGVPGDVSYLGYDEATVLKNVIYSLEAISKKNHKNITLLIRPHPREAENDFVAYHSSQITIITSSVHEGRDCVMASDLVVGMTSVLLVEACYLGCIVVSLQPGLCKTDTLPTNEPGVSMGVYREDEITRTLEKFLFDDAARCMLREKTAALTLESQAARRIVNYIFQHINLKFIGD